MRSVRRYLAAAIVLVSLAASSALAAEWEAWYVTVRGTAADYTGRRYAFREYDTLLINYDAFPYPIMLLDSEDFVIWEGVADMSERFASFAGYSVSGDDTAVGYLRFNAAGTRISGKQYEWYWDGEAGWYIQTTVRGVFDGYWNLADDLADLRAAMAARRAAKPAAGLVSASGADAPVRRMDAVRARQGREVTPPRGAKP